MMTSPFRTFKSAVATAVSLWMAVLACLMGCTIPSLANSAPLNVSATGSSLINASLLSAKSAGPSQPDLMAGMENCPHHSRGNAPAKHNDRKPVRGGAMSCCPVEVTVASKPNIATLQISPAHSFVLRSHFSLAQVRLHHAVEFVSALWHSGRDTLLETHLLRI
jgi:hypothetical protein